VKTHEFNSHKHGALDFDPHDLDSCFTRHAISAYCYPACECKCHISITPLFLVLSKLTGLDYMDMLHDMHRHAAYAFKTPKIEP